MQKGDKVIIENLFIHIHADLSYINRRMSTKRSGGGP